MRETWVSGHLFGAEPLTLACLPTSGLLYKREISILFELVNCGVCLFLPTYQIQQHNKMHTEEIKTEDRWEIQRAAWWDSKGASWKEEPMRRVLGNIYLVD